MAFFSLLQIQLVQVNYDGSVKSRKTPSFVIPAKAGIQSFQ